MNTLMNNNTNFAWVQGMYEKLPEDIRNSQGWILLATPAAFLICDLAKELIKNGYNLDLKTKAFELHVEKPIA